MLTLFTRMLFTNVVDLGEFSVENIGSSLSIPG